MGLLGDKYVEISPGSLEAMNIEPGDTIPGGQTPGLESVIEASARSVQQVEQFVEEIENLVGLVRGGEGLIGGLLTDKELMGDFRRTVNALASVSSALDTGRGTLGKLVVDTALYHEVSVAVGRLGRMARLAASSRSTFHKVMTDTTIYRDLKATVGSLAALTDGNGGVTALLSDPQFAAKVRETVTIFNSLLEEIKANPEKYFNFELF
jgi:phospholipid/cholesterol/gamma-HCH transport system substrate-binding protein